MERERGGAEAEPSSRPPPRPAAPAAQRAAATASQGGMADRGEGAGQWLINLIMEPGTSVQLMPVINAALVALICIMAYTGFVSPPEVGIHCYVMCGIAACLIAILNWFVGEFKRVKALQEGGDATGDAAGPAEGKKTD